MKSVVAQRRLAPRSIVWLALGLLVFGGRGNAGEASEPVVWDQPDPAPAVVPAAADAKGAKRELEAARAKAAELESARAVRFKSPVNTADCRVRPANRRAASTKAPAKWGFSRKA